MNKERIIHEILMRWRNPHHCTMGEFMTRDKAFEIEEFIEKSVDLAYERGHNDGYDMGLNDGYKGRERDMEASSGFPHP